MGVVETPDGKPAAGVVVNSISYFAPEAKHGQLIITSDADTRTDDRGRFQFVVHTPGEVILKLLPEKYAVSVHTLDEKKRGDVGRFVLRKGLPITGRVLDADGTPLAGVIVSAAGFPKDPAQDPMDIALWRDMSTSLTRGRHRRPWRLRDRADAPRGVSGGPGRAQPRPRARRNVPELARTVHPGEGDSQGWRGPRAPGIRALPYVVVEARFHDSKGKPLQSRDFRLGGMLGAVKPRGLLAIGRSDDDLFWSGSSCPDASGKLVFHAPRGLELASIDLMSFLSDEHRSMRHRIGKDAPLRNANQIKIVDQEPVIDVPDPTFKIIDQKPVIDAPEPTLKYAKLDRDVRSIEIISYRSPTVIVKVAAKDGSKPKGARVTIAYAGSPPPGEETVAEHVPSFAEQTDGRFRSQRLLPDETAIVTAEADGFSTRTQILKLSEGVVKELELVLEEKRASGPGVRP